MTHKTLEDGQVVLIGGPGAGGGGASISNVKSASRIETAIGFNTEGKDDDVLINNVSEDIMNDLKEEYGDYDPETFEEIDYSYVSDALYDWSVDSHGKFSIWLQVAAENEFGSSLSEFTKQKMGGEGGVLVEEQRLLRNIYDRTQQELRRMGYGSDDLVVLHRGRAGELIPSGRMKGNALESWTTSNDVAKFYVERNQDVGKGGYIMTSAVPVRQILSLPYTGLGLGSVDEVVILGGIPLDIYIEEVVSD